MDDLSFERWRQIDHLFAEALDRDPADRIAFLRAACASDLALYHEVVALVASEEDAERSIGESVTEFAAPFLTDLQDVLKSDKEDVFEGSQVGPYLVVRMLGRGGMGSVYLVERADGQFKRNAALKVVRRGMDTDDVLQRFRYERQILAALDHPSIARLFDGGMTDDGRPYLVMEYVEGTPITQYCNEHHLSVERRLELFVGVCEAVDYAHRNLVVHRDLKPSNMLVTSDGDIKLLDFGIARILADDASLSTAPLTRPGARLATRSYASPEQLAGRQITTASDVYQLGLLLYELLCGRRPFESDREASPPEDAMLRVPLRPGMAVASSPTDAAVSTARERAATPEQLQRQLKGDLDAITIFALRPEPSRRYSSARALAEDIRRHLAGHLITARRGDNWYRGRRLFVRNRFLLSAAGGFLLLAAGLASLYVARIGHERDLATSEAAKSAAAVAFVERLFEGADPDATLGDTLTVFELLDRGARELQHMQGPADVRAFTQHTIGKLYLKLGEYDMARPLLEEASAAIEAGPRTQASDRAQVLIDRAHLALNTGDRPGADSLFIAAIGILGEGATREQKASAFVEYGSALQVMGRYDEARSYIARAEEGAIQDPELATDARFVLATILMNEGDYEGAETLLREVIDRRRAQFGGVHSLVADAVNNLGNLLYDTRKYDEAESLLQESLQMRRDLFGDLHPAVSESYNNLALVPYARGEYAAAESLLFAALNIVEALIGRENPEYGMTLNNIGYVRMDQGDLPGAVVAFRDALGIMQRASGAVSPDAALVLGNVGTALRQMGEMESAEGYLREALAARRSIHGDENMHVAWRLYALADLLREMKRYDESVMLHEESVATRRKVRDDGHFDIGRGLRGLGHALLDAGRDQEAERALDESRAMLQKLGDAGSAEEAAVRDLLISLYDRSGRDNEATALRNSEVGADERAP